MNDYREWPEKSINVTSLYLDSRNPRIPHVAGDTKQRDLAAQLIEHDKVYELAKDIAEQGYFPTEVLIGVEEGGRKVILEGNRRLAALKLLLSPEFAPSKYQKRFQALHARVAPETISKVRVVFAPSRDEAAPIIVKRHTVTGVKRWERSQQAQYLREFVDGDQTIDELARRLGIPKADLSSMLKSDTMYQVANTLDLPEKTKVIVSNPRAFNISTLDRIVESASFGPFIGIAFDEYGQFKGKVIRGEFEKAYARIVSDIAHNKVDSRKINTDRQIKDYLDSLGSDRPNLGKRGAFSSESFFSDVEPADDEGDLADDLPKRPRRHKGLIPPGIKCRLTNPRIEGLFKELRRLSVADYPNSCGVTFRVLFELLVANYLDKTGKIKPILALHKGKGKPDDWYPTFRQTLTALLDDKDSSLELNPQARKFFKQMATDRHHLLTIDRLDQFVHNKFGTPTEPQLREFWEASEELLQQLLVEPRKADPARKGSA